MNYSFKKISSVLTILGIAAIILSCGSSKNLNIERGTGYNFKAGYPEFRASAFGFINKQNKAILKLTVEVVKGSLIYKKKNDSDTLSAHFALNYQVQRQDESNEVVISKQLKKDISSTDENISDSREHLTLTFPVQVNPGKFKVIVNVQDLNSNKNISQTLETYIPNTETGAYTLSKVQMFGKSNGQKKWNQINTYDVKGKVDSLRFLFQVISKQTDKQMRVNTKLLRFESDTSYARPMHYPNYSQSSIEYKGIDYDEETEVQSNQRLLTDYSSVFIEFKIGNPKRGNYRFEVRAKKQDAEDEIYKARAFGVKSEDYPNVSTPRELAGPLVYLMGEKDHKKLMSISDPDSMKKQIDRFWLKNIGNASKAKDVIEMYYQRVEEANKQFSNFKEGWKTDPGMIYILFGPPYYTDSYVKQVVWYYSYNRDDPEYSYLFYQPKLNNKYFPFYHFLLQRSNNYYTVQYQQRQLWLTGLILTRSI